VRETRKSKILFKWLMKLQDEKITLII